MNKLNYQLVWSLEVHIYKFIYSNGLISILLKSSVILGIVRQMTEFLTSRNTYTLWVNEIIKITIKANIKQNA